MSGGLAARATPMGSSTARARHIADVLARHGLWHLLDATGLAAHIPMHRHPNRDGAKLTIEPSELRAALEELGPTFMKLGQILSTRSDLLDRPFIDELSRLQDAAAPIPFGRVAEIIEGELDRPLGQAYAWFDHEPLAAGSIGQVHGARLQDGTEVVVKVRRPDALALIEDDLRLLRLLAKFAHRHWGNARDYDLPSLVREFDRTIHQELDYQHEADNAELFRRNLNEANVHVPMIYADLSTSNVLTMERVRGIKVTDADALTAAGIDGPMLASKAAAVFLKMVLEDGFFHADLHPGNVFVESQETIAVIDFGMAGTLGPSARSQVAVLLMGVVEADADHIIDSLVGLDVVVGEIDRPALKHDLKPVLEDARLGGRSAHVLTEVVGVMRRHHLVLPSNVSLLVKAVVTGEGTAIQLDPSFSLAEAAGPFLRSLALKALSPQALAGRLALLAPDLAWIITEGPASVRRLLTELESGTLRVGVEHNGFEPALKRLQSAANRVIGGMLLSALIVAAGLSISAYRPELVNPLTARLAVGGASLIAILGVSLILDIRRGPR